MLLIIGSALAIFGVLWCTCSLVSALQFPVAGYGAWNLVAGIALVAVGLAVVARGWSVRNRSH